MGRVWRAADEILDRPVAVKEMRIDGLDAEDARTRRERTLREARATARIDHPNVVRVYDVVDEGERLWIVMELVAGRSLERIIAEDGPLGPAETARLGLGLVEALRQVHARGVLHRDIKPGNVLVEEGKRGGRRIVLTDFGIAAIQDAKALTMVGMLVGSPDYMAPERVSGRPQGPPSDIWSLGATLCAALGGRSPFSRDTTLATLHAVLYEEPELPASSGPLSDVLAALLEKDPSVRPGLEELEGSLSPIAFPAPMPTMPTLPVGGGEGAGPEGGAEEEEPVEGPESGSEPETRLEAVAQDEREREARLEGTEQAAPSVPDEPEAEASAESEVPSASNESEETPPLPWTPNESPTPAYLETRTVRTVRDPRRREPEPSAAPNSEPEREPEPVRDTPVAAPADAVPTGMAPADTASSDHTSTSTDPADKAPAAAAPAPVAVAPEAPSPPARREPSEAPEPFPSPQPPSPPHHSEPFTPQPPSASTEVVSEERSEVRSETPSGNSVGSAPGAAAPAASSPTATALTRDALTRAASQEPAATHRSGSGSGVSLVRSEAVTERRPGPVLGPHPLRVPPGELPGPAVPATPRRGRRRTGLIAATAVVAAGAVVAIVLTTMSGPPGDDKAGSSPSASSSQGGSVTPSPSPTVEGTSRPRTLPPGAHEEAGGFGWATPTGWRRDVKTGAEVHYTSPDGKQELAAKSSLARGDLMETWKTSEQNAHQGRDYRKIRLEETEFRGNPAVVWEYTFTLEGVPWHARLLGFNANGKSYQINTWYQPDIETQALKTYDKVRDSFTVL
ncbi:protein kinase domain-containing protein [Streptomyces fulvoviolaceus]|uniref:protein kinase domain-containing protein n=1 Tax=Streptomyces fulvoviolaceus TaxID=285535 RepID=UPI0021C048F0|nr:protein kinase [Streptomyces fulvoviolaceus]MCT9078615.1 protein kinase [Streptomyces fulvoviolaceus]